MLSSYLETLPLSAYNSGCFCMVFVYMLCLSWWLWGFFFSSSSGSPTVSERFPYCLLPSFVIVMSCCHICSCDASFVYPSPTPGLYGAFHWHRAYPHVFFSGSSFFEELQRLNWIGDWFAQVCIKEVFLTPISSKSRGRHQKLVSRSWTEVEASLTSVPRCLFPWLKQGFIVLLRGRL